LAAVNGGVSGVFVVLSTRGKVTPTLRNRPHATVAVRRLRELPFLDLEREREREKSSLPPSLSRFPRDSYTYVLLLREDVVTTPPPANRGRPRCHLLRMSLAQVNVLMYTILRVLLVKSIK